MNRRIFVVGYGENYANWMEGEIVEDIDKADLVVFTGGEDVSPSLYNENKNPHTYCNMERDKFEMDFFYSAKNRGIPMVGICRGSQFLCVMNGGKLVQDQPNNSFHHDMNTYDGNTLNITSTHHQAQWPYNLPKDEYHILGWTENYLGFHRDGNSNELDCPKECEIVFYSKNNCLGIQGHPEMMSMDRDEDSLKWLKELLNKFLGGTLMQDIVDNKCEISVE